MSQPISLLVVVVTTGLVRDSSFNMTRGVKILRGGLRKFLDTRKGGL